MTRWDDPTPTRWEYLVIHEEDWQTTGVRTEQLNGFGSLGWELVAVTNLRGAPPLMYFKRRR